MIKVVQLRLVAESQADAESAIEALRESVGAARVALSAPHEGRRGQWLSYGVLQVQQVESEPQAVTSPTTRLRRRS